MPKLEKEWQGSLGQPWTRNPYQTWSHSHFSSRRSPFGVTSSNIGGYVIANPYINPKGITAPIKSAKTLALEKLTASVSLLSTLVAGLLVVELLPYLTQSIFLEAGLIGLFAVFLIPLLDFTRKSL